MLTRLWPIAVITFKEGVRNRALYGIGAIAVFLLLGTQLVCSMIPRDVGKVAVDLALSSTSFAGLLIVLFIGINLMAKDLDRRTIYMVLARPISRGQYILGKFCGMGLIIGAAMTLLGGAATVSVLLTRVLYPNYFDKFTLSTLFLAILFQVLSLLLLTALSFLYSALSSTSFISLLLTVITYLIGQVTTDIKALVETADKVGIQVSAAMTFLVKAVYYLFPNLSLFDIKLQAAHGLPVPLTYVAMVSGYWFLFTALALVAAVLIFERREFP
ncbi:MAG: ABC transporter permease [Desulfuromonadales bacterium]|nr:ABC transporter permease [Desulfuromonadales bacterium]